MNTRFGSLAARWVALGCTLTALSLTSAGTFKRISIDGSFADWAGVLPAATDAEGDSAAGFDLKEIYVANDAEYLYFMVKIYPSSTNTDYSKFHHHFFIDSDNDPSTGFAGAEMAVEDGWAFSQRYGKAWYEGDVSGLDAAQAPAGVLPTLQYEYRISRSVRDVNPADVPAGSGNPARDLPVFTQDTIGIRWDVMMWDWSVQEDVGPSFTYDMAPTPPAFSGTQQPLELTTTSWQVNDAGVDLATDWLAAAYDDTQYGWKAGRGLFGFNAPGGTYPAPVNTVLTSGLPTYYLRAHFTWNNDMNGVGLLVSNYLSAGALIYLNGAELKRVRMPEGAVSYNTPATGGPVLPGTAELIDLPTGGLVVGDNILQVEVHPATGATGSLVFGLSLTASDNFPPRILDPSLPPDRSIVEGQTTTFTVGTVAGTGPFTYQWLKDGMAVSGATNSTLTLNPVVETNAGSYSVEISNPKGLKVTSRSAVLTTTAVPVALTDPNQPADQTAGEGMSATFAVTVTGSLPVYQWYKGTDPIPGATGPQLTLNNVAASDNGTQYSVTVTNRLNSVTSRKASLTVVRDSTPPAITRAAGGGRAVQVTFSEALDPVSAQQAGNYTLDGGVQVQSAVLDPVSATSVTLTTTPQQFGRPYKLSANGVRDLFGNASASTFYFQSSILIDGKLDEWDSIPVALTQDQMNPGTAEFKELAVTNDADYIYIRLSFYEPVGPLAAADWGTLGNYWQVVFDTDNDPTTGGWHGGEVLDEVNTVYRLVPNGWTDPVPFVGGDSALAPAEVTGTNFEMRVSLHAKHPTDNLPAFPNPTMGITCVIRNTSWTEVDTTSPAVIYTLGTLPPMPPTITIRRIGNMIELTWPGGGQLQTRSSLTTGDWTTVPGAASGIQIDPTAPAAGNSAYYRVQQ